MLNKCNRGPSDDCSDFFRYDYDGFRLLVTPEKEDRSPSINCIAWQSSYARRKYMSIVMPLDRIAIWIMN